MSISRVNPTLPVQDLKRAEQFYQDKLGLKIVREDPSPGALLQGCSSCYLYLYQRPPTVSDHTEAGFTVSNVEETMQELRSKGVKFEDYDQPGLKTVNGLFSIGDMKAAWFKDSEGNIVAISNS